jgi:pilus assembly protein Flp/PilA
LTAKRRSTLEPSRTAGSQTKINMTSHLRRELYPIGSINFQEATVNTLALVYLYVRNYFSSEEGQGMAEYGLILALVAVAAIAALTAMGGGLGGIFDNISGELGGAVPAAPAE